MGATSQEVSGALSSLREDGFINYFGLQRFGQGGVATHTTGALLFKGLWKEAVASIMAVSLKSDEGPPPPAT